ncbi:PRC and DUF2382 domain-containing protein [Deinococcus radiophilus]|uniref:DUF2382 domain-containing protein n=1 Tax=Deinococcus radiophilus TaxID=32062 RepID=A0A3S0RKL6_9DEIO|nr:DUF2382 domain-containing protein [Deinococcus radiophilus]RTR30727.1 DUF2382 domain-containing protein [Deinococcus radiophilus]UFA51280.1 DUF2382 domain-containing protein [Deinococcus radiophilus]
MTDMIDTQLVRLSDLSRDDQMTFFNDADVFNPIGSTAYGANGEKIGSVRDALVVANTGGIRFLIVDAGGWFSSKEVLVPVGHARIDDSGVYFDTLTKDQVGSMQEYRYGETYSDDVYTQDQFVQDERVLRGTMDETEYRERAYATPDRLQLLEERLTVNKERFKAGSVRIGKHVETRQEQIEVPLQREEVVITRHEVTDATPVDGARLGEGQQTMQVDLEAERANVSKQAYVTEEVEIGKRAVTETQTVTETVGREVLDVDRDGQIDVDGTVDPNRRA